MTPDRDRLATLARKVMSAWNTQDIDTVLACYTADVVYIDPNTRGAVVGHDAMRAYLAKLFGRWTMTWEPGEILPLADTDGVAIRWTGTLTPAGDDRVVEIGGLDLVILEGDLIKRNEVYFDRSRLATFLTPLPSRTP